MRARFARPNGSLPRDFSTHTNYSILLSMHEWVMTVGGFGVQFFLVTLMLVPIETFNISFENSRNMQQYGTKMTFTQVRKSLW